MVAAHRDSLTVYFGEDVSADEAAALAAEVGAKYPEAEVAVYEGGQPHYHYILSAE
jgi:dihydroxyacetone kinase-like predicted kinase